jgi:hypothetical protein
MVGLAFFKVSVCTPRYRIYKRRVTLSSKIGKKNIRKKNELKDVRALWNARAHISSSS